MMTPGEAQHEQSKEKKMKDHNESTMLFDNDQSHVMSVRPKGRHNALQRNICR